MTDTFGTMDAARGEVLRNPGWDDKYTCPGCHADHHHRVEWDDAVFIRCSCGAPLRLELETEPVPTCTIADEDEEEENLS